MTPVASRREAGHGNRSGEVIHRLAWWTDDGRSAGLLRLMVPTDGPAQLELGLVGTGEPCMLVTDHAVPPPTGGGLEVRTSGLWAEVVVEEAPAPGRGHMSAGLEAFGMVLDDPDEAWRGGPDHQFRGDRVPVGLDLGAEAVGDPVVRRWGLGVPCRLDGEVLVADRVFDVDGWAWWLVGEPPPGNDLVMARADDDSWVLATGEAARRWGESTSEGELLVGPSPDGAIGRAPVLIEWAGRELRVDRWFGSMIGPDDRTGVGWRELSA